jgi:hypothetical protein
MFDFGRPKIVSVPFVEERLVDVVGDDLMLSTRSVSHSLQYCNYVINNSLHTTYKVQKVQAPISADIPVRLLCCRWLPLSAHGGFHRPSKAPGTEECSFTRDGV